MDEITIKKMKMKEATKKWRMNHKEQYNEYLKERMRLYRQRNNDHVRLVRRNKYKWEQISKLFSQILIE